MSFWDNVQTMVFAQKTTYRWLSDVLGIAETTVSGWRRTDVLPRADQAQLIAKALGVSVEYLVTGKDTGDPWLADHAGLVRNLKALSDDQLDTVAIQVEALAIASRQQAKRG